VDRSGLEELPDYAEVFRSVSREKSGSRVVAKPVKYSGPVLIIDFYNVFPGETVSLEALSGVLSRKEGVYRVVLFGVDDVEMRIKEVTGKLSENEGILGRWKLVFTDPGRYRGFYVFRRFMDDYSGKVKELVFL
jgi:hypothetical protein